MKSNLPAAKRVRAHDSSVKVRCASRRSAPISSREVEPLVEQEHALQGCLDGGLRAEDENHSAVMLHVLDVQLKRVMAGISQLEIGFGLSSRLASSSSTSCSSMIGGWQGVMPTPGERRLADIVARHSALRRTLDQLAAGCLEYVVENRILKVVAHGHAEMASRLTVLLRGGANEA